MDDTWSVLMRVGRHEKFMRIHAESDRDAVCGAASLIFGEHPWFLDAWRTNLPANEDAPRGCAWWRPGGPGGLAELHLEPSDADVDGCDIEGIDLQVDARLRPSTWRCVECGCARSSPYRFWSPNAYSRRPAHMNSAVWRWLVVSQHDMLMGPNWSASTVAADWVPRCVWCVARVGLPPRVES